MAQMTLSPDGAYINFDCRGPAARVRLRKHLYTD
jgi:hypothetical protein